MKKILILVLSLILFAGVSYTLYTRKVAYDAKNTEVAEEFVREYTEVATTDLPLTTKDTTVWIPVPTEGDVALSLLNSTLSTKFNDLTLELSIEGNTRIGADVIEAPAYSKEQITLIEDSIEEYYASIIKEEDFSNVSLWTPITPQGEDWNEVDYMVNFFNNNTFHFSEEGEGSLKVPHTNTQLKQIVTSTVQSPIISFEIDKMLVCGNDDILITVRQLDGYHNKIEVNTYIK